MLRKVKTNPACSTQLMKKSRFESLDILKGLGLTNYLGCLSKKKYWKKCLQEMKDSTRMKNNIIELSLSDIETIITESLSYYDLYKEEE